MAVIALTNYSAEVTKSTPSLNGGALTQLKTDEFSGRVRIARFTFTPTVAVAATAVIACCLLPAGARIIQGKLTSNAFVATSTMDIGLVAADAGGTLDAPAGAGTVADNSAFFASALAVANAGEYFFATTQALNYGYETVIPVYLVAKLNTAGMDGVTDSLQGHVLYVKD